MLYLFSEEYLAHYGVKGMKWGKNIMAKAGDAAEFLTGFRSRSDAEQHQAIANTQREAQREYLNAANYHASRAATVRNYTIPNTQKEGAQARRMAQVSINEHRMDPKNVSARSARSTKYYYQSQANASDSEVRRLKGAAKSYDADVKAAKSGGAFSADGARREAMIHEKAARRALRKYETKTIPGIAKSTVNKGLDFIKKLFGN